MESNASHEHHVIPPSTFIKTFAILTFLMIATIAASLIHYPDQSPVWSFVANGIALTIAIIKGTLVFLYFMGAKYATRLTQVFAALGFIWVLLMGIVVCDYATRHFEPTPGWEAVNPSPNTQLTDPKMKNPFEPKHAEGGSESH